MAYSLCPIHNSKWCEIVDNIQKHDDVFKKNVNKFNDLHISKIIKLNKEKRNNVNCFYASSYDCILFDYKLHVNQYIDMKNISKHIKYIELNIGGRHIDSICGDQICASLISCNKKMSYVKTETTHTTIIPLCFFISENYLPLMLLGYSECVIKINYNDTYLNCDVFATQIIGYDDINKKICYVV